MNELIDRVSYNNIEVLEVITRVTASCEDCYFDTGCDSYLGCSRPKSFQSCNSMCNGYHKDIKYVRPSQNSLETFVPKRDVLRANGLSCNTCYAVRELSGTVTNGSINVLGDIKVTLSVDKVRYCPECGRRL